MSSLAHFVDRFVREELGHVAERYSSVDVQRIIERIKGYYNSRKVVKDYIAEIKEALKNEDFVKDLRKYIIEFLENRPTQDRVDYYNDFCRKYGLTPKAIINKNKLEDRISKIIKTGGKSQDVR